MDDEAFASAEDSLLEWSQLKFSEDTARDLCSPGLPVQQNNLFYTGKSLRLIILIIMMVGSDFLAGPGPAGGAGGILV